MEAQEQVEKAETKPQYTGVDIGAIMSFIVTVVFLMGALTTSLARGNIDVAYLTGAGFSFLFLYVITQR